MQVGDKYRVNIILELAGGHIYPGTIIKIKKIYNGCSVESDEGIVYKNIKKESIERKCINYNKHRIKIIKSYYNSKK